MGLTLTNDQDMALIDMAKWAKTPSEPEYRLAGFAGTGKTTLVDHFISTIDEEPILACPTGKAARVLEEKVGREVSTVHSLLYSPTTTSAEVKLQELMDSLELHPDREEELGPLITDLQKEVTETGVRFTSKDTPGIMEDDIVIIDEASMVDEQMRDDLLATGGRILFVGDSGQLPPIKDKSFFEKHQPNFTLEKVVRQALDSPIIRASMEIRTGTNPDFMGRGDGEIFSRTPRAHFDWDEYLEADQIITGRNKTRHDLNRWFRKRLGHCPSNAEMDSLDWMPKANEKLICLKNDRNRDPQMINGVICSALGPATWEEKKFYLSLLYDERPIEKALAYAHPLINNYRPGSAQITYQMRRGMAEFDFGYAITCHKAQGSEWDYVIICDDEMQARNVEFRRRWLYTAITRAKTKLQWII